MIGKIVKTEDAPRQDGLRERYTKIAWDLKTADLGSHLSGVPLAGPVPNLHHPRFSKLPGIHGKVGDTVEVTVEVIPQETEEERHETT